MVNTNKKRVFTKKVNRVFTKKVDRVFTKKDFLSGDGMLTPVWGPSLWHFLHMMSFNYPVNPSKEDKKNYKEYMYNLQHILPCKFCRDNLKKNYKLFPITERVMKNRDSFSRYVYELHEIINKMLGKKSGLTYCDVRERYEHFRARCSDELKSKTVKPPIIPSQITRKKKEKGCTEPLYGKYAKCVIKIVPQEEKCPTLQIDKKCYKSKKAEEDI
jgi:hypothetical protein